MIVCRSRTMNFPQELPQNYINTGRWCTLYRQILRTDKEAATDQSTVKFSSSNGISIGPGMFFMITLAQSDGVRFAAFFNGPHTRAGSNSYILTFPYPAFIYFSDGALFSPKPITVVVLSFLLCTSYDYRSTNRAKKARKRFS